MTTWTGTALFIGQGVWSNVPASLHMGARTFNFVATGSLTALGVKPANRIVAHFIGHSSVNVITKAPRLTATARFVGNGRFIERADATAKVLSTKNTNRMSFPTFPNPGDPFMRRPSKDYNNYSISVRFTGSGRITAIAS
jgi:hypothetical protein